MAAIEQLFILFVALLLLIHFKLTTAYIQAKGGYVIDTSIDCLNR